jgi:hypothetical protein
VKNLKVVGFDDGISTRHGTYSVAYKDITLEGQRVSGLDAGGGPWTFIHGLRSRNRVTALKMRKGCLIGGDLQGGDPASPAIETSVALVRDVKVGGYGVAVRRVITSKMRKRAAKGRGSLPPEDVPSEVKGPFVEEYSTHGTAQLFPGPKGSMRLPVPDVPEVPWDPPARWANVEKFKPEAEGEADGEEEVSVDWAKAFQDAIDSGATTVYFPARRTYRMARTIHIRGNVRRIICFHSRFLFPGELVAMKGVKDGQEVEVKRGAEIQERHYRTGKAAFRFEDGRSPVVVLERFITGLGNPKGWLVDHASRRTLVLRNISGKTKGFRSAPEGRGGRAFGEDVNMWFMVKDQTLHAWQVNSEWPFPRLVNDGGTVWVCGYKCEGHGPNLLLTNGGRTELLGGWFYAYKGSGGYPGVIVDESDFSGCVYGWSIEQRRGGETKTHKGKAPLFVGYREGVTPSGKAP